VEHATERRRPLRQQQPVERRRGGNQRGEARAGRIELAPDLVVALLADICHRRAKDAAALAGQLGLAVPADRLAPVLVAKEAPRGDLAPDPVAEADRLRARIAVIARRRDFDTTPPGIEGVMTPGNAGRLAHSVLDMLSVPLSGCGPVGRRAARLLGTLEVDADPGAQCARRLGHRVNPLVLAAKDP
jgi:hypothetical protein